MTLINQPSAAPTRKLTAATMAALASSVAADVLIGFLPAVAGVDPGELELLIEALLVTGVTFAAGYMVRDRA